MSASGQVQMSALVMATSSFWVLFRGSGDCKCGKTAYSIVDSVGKAASSAADSAQVSTMSSVSDDLSVVVAGFRCFLIAIILSTMPARHHHRYSVAFQILSTITPESCPRSAGIGVHV